MSHRHHPLSRLSVPADFGLRAEQHSLKDPSTISDSLSLFSFLHLFMEPVYGLFGYAVPLQETSFGEKRKKKQGEKEKKKKETRNKKTCSSRYAAIISSDFRRRGHLSAE